RLRVLLLDRLDDLLLKSGLVDGHDQRLVRSSRSTPSLDSLFDSGLGVACSSASAGTVVCSSVVDSRSSRSAPSCFSDFLTLAYPRTSDFTRPLYGSPSST